MVTPGDAAHTSATHIARKTQRHPACDLYLPGHLVHNIAAKKSWESSDPVRWGRFQGVEDGCLIVRYLDGEGRYRIHRPTEVGRVAQVGDKVRVSERWRTATVSRRFEQLLTVCIALEDDPWRPCSIAPSEPATLDDLAVHAAERGGFTVPGRRLAQLVGRGSGAGDDPPPDGAVAEVS
jgi:hypothetical protein